MACKITIEKIKSVFDNNKNIFRKPTRFESKYRIVKSTNKGFKVISTHHTKQAAIKKAKRLIKK